MTKTKEEKLAFLDDTVKFFNSNNLCLTEGGSCRYFLEGKAGCAIGRHIPDTALCRRLDSHLDGAATSLDEDFIWSSIPEELQAYGRDFLISIQKLHDFSDYWTTNGLSEDGRAFAESIHAKVCEGAI